ncbi:MAG: hypothetical protein HC825_11835 [Oscillatoriales cyanobacterium RM1_1_9]|nr:hypothetical protein [Oscillatoriales cyanobacterium SM2_3_0]NJO46849.1 hypothetical protein [Oscillatoriales cyanobacterium RM2_1_1]NJO72164.1 hypothetical protein [Oscillatoriales cyanobacterium RM1_1_9]
MSYDFEVGIDAIALANGLTVDQVSLSVVGGNTEIMVGDEVLAILTGVEDPTQVDISVM